MSEIPLKPMSRADIHRLETALMIATLLRPDVLEKIKSAEDRLTWIDSLAVAAGALAREKFGMPVSKIADELGRSEATIRRHLTGKSEAGKLIMETYRKFAVDGVKIELPTGFAEPSEISRLKEELNATKRELEELKKRVENTKSLLHQALDLLSK
ncbi:MAG: transcriptional regulator [Thermoprotei archaeon]|nr:MAG: transcriptional regulator [Thermoprotei archaeon]